MSTSKSNTEPKEVDLYDLSDINDKTLSERENIERYKLRLVKDTPKPIWDYLDPEKMWTTKGTEIVPNVEVMKEHLRGEGRIHPEEAKKLISMAAELFKKEPNLLQLQDPISVCGDVHGQYFDLLKLFEIGGDPKEGKYLFLGDYVDRGCFGTEVVFLMLSYKILYPDTFFMLRGNHECRHLTAYFNFKKECLYKYDLNIYNEIMNCFDCLPLSALLNGRFFCVHGGLSPNIQSIKEINEIDRFTEPPSVGPMCDMLWSDPMDEQEEYINSNAPFVHNELRGCSYVFSYNAVNSFLKKNNLLSVIRAHEAQDEGYRLYKHGPTTNFPTVICIFSAPNYCLSGDSIISNDPYTGHTIESFKQFNECLSYGKDKSIHKSSCEFMKVPVQKELCKLILADGRELKLTRDHRVLVNRNEKQEWIKAEDLRVSSSINNLDGDKIIVSSLPLLFEEDDKEQIEKYNIFDSIQGAEQKLAFVRLSAIAQSSQFRNNSILLKSKLDAILIQEQIKQLNSSYVIDKNIYRQEHRDGDFYTVELPDSISELLSFKNHPDFITNKSCPLSIKREYLATFIAFNVQIPSIRHNEEHNTFEMTELKYSLSARTGLNEGIKEYMENIKDMFTLFDISSEDIEHKQSTERDMVKSSLSIKPEQISNLMKNVGIRYSMEKLQKLTYLNSLIQYGKKLGGSTFDFQKIVSLFDIMYNFEKNQWIEQEIIEENMTFSLPIIATEEIDGKHDVYDLCVPETHCFFASGIVTHNCDMYNNKGAIIRFQNNLMNIRQFNSSPHPYYLPNFMNALNWSIPFVTEKTLEMFHTILHLCEDGDSSDEEDEKSKPEEDDKMIDKERADSIKAKIRSVARLSRMYRTLREERETILLLKGLAGGNLPQGLLSQGPQALKNAVVDFKSAKKIDAPSEKRPKFNQKLVKQGSNPETLKLLKKMKSDAIVIDKDQPTPKLKIEETK